MTKKRGMVISLLLAAVVVSAAGIGGTKYYKAKAKTNEISSFINEVNKSRTAVRKTTTKVKPEYADWLKEDKSPFTDKELEDMRNYKDKFNSAYENSVLKFNPGVYDKSKELTSKQAKEDVDRLFNLFKYAYSAYGYYGGDAKFNAVKTDILSQIQDNSKITVEDFRKIMISDLSFITDMHFQLIGDSNNYDTRGEYYYVGDDNIGRDDSGYYKLKADKKYYIKEVNNDKNVAKYIHRTIGKDGTLSYKIAVMDKASVKGMLAKTLTLKSDNKKESFENVILKYQALYDYKPNYDKAFSYSVQDNVPIVKISRFYNASQNEKVLSDFVDTAVKMKKYPVAILDLRGNQGGFLSTVEQWIASYYGVLNEKDNLISRGASMTLQSPVIKALDQTSYNELFKVQAGHESKTIKSKNTLFVLMDKGSASASEYFLEALSNMDNVVLVGTNTAGCMLNVNPSYYKLNNSSLNVYMGNMLYLSPLGDSFEGKGFDPDLLVNSKDALDSTLKLIKYYKLNSK